MSNTRNRFSAEVRARAVRMVMEHQGEHTSIWAAIESIAPKIGCATQTLHNWIKRAEIDDGDRPMRSCVRRQPISPPSHRLQGQTSAGQRDGARPPVQEMIAFITAHRDQYGVEPICRVLPITPSTYYARLATQTDPIKLSDRVRRDHALRPVIKRVFAENYGVYGVRKVWRQMRREG